MVIQDCSYYEEGLKPCPECGGTAGLFPSEVTRPEYAKKSWSVWCRKCKIHTSEYGSTGKAKESWNEGKFISNDILEEAYGLFRL